MFTKKLIKRLLFFFLLLPIYLINTSEMLFDFYLNNHSMFLTEISFLYIHFFLVLACLPVSLIANR